jgi:polysaccharide pyruvyl transferase WcaK-like protein
VHLHIGHTFFGAGNFGDDLVLAGFLKGIAGAMPGLRITCAIAFDCDSQRRRFPKIEWSVYDPASCQTLIAACDVWVGLGGSIFQEADDSWLLGDQLLQLEACRRYGKPVFFLGSGVDYRIDAQRPEIRALLDAASWIWTRDTLSTTALQRMGFDRVTTAADLSHLAMQEMPPVQIASGTTGFVCNFERDTDYSIESLASLIEAAANCSPAVAWLVQEIRMLPGSEFDIYHRLPAQTRRLMALRQPNYSTNSISELVRSWDGSDRLFSTRFHGAIIGAWSGSRVVVFERQKKLRGLSEDLGIVSFPSMPGPDELARAFDRAPPIPLSVLETAVRSAETACNSFLKAADLAATALARSRQRSRDETMVNRLPQPPIECHSLDGVAHVGLDRIGPGLKRGDGMITISAVPQATDRSALRAPVDPHAEAIEHFARAADRFHSALQIYNEAHGQWGLATLCHARTAAVYALLGLPGNVIRDRLEAPASRLIWSMLGSDDRRMARTAEEEITFIECWRRLGRCWNEEACFGHGLALLALSRHGFELIGLEPLAKDLGWTEPLWIRCLLEVMPAGAQPENSDLTPDILPPLMAQVRDRLSRLDPAIKDELFKARDAVVSYVQPNSFAEADTASLHRQIETLTGHLKEANADRELSHQNIHTLAAHLKEANADRELSHQNIHTLAAHLKEANADRELSHQNIHTLASHLQQANASLEAIKNRHGFIAVSRLSAVLARVFSRHADRT